MADYYFNIPPIDQLTVYQQGALKVTNAIALSGGPGTGKSVVSLYRHIVLTNQGKKSQLLTYTTTLSQYLKACCKILNEVASNNVTTTYKWVWNPISRDEIIVDEAQDVEIEKYKDLIINSPVISYGADESQSLYRGSTLSELKSMFPKNQLFTLGKNFRNTKCILKLAYSAFPDANVSLQEIESCISEGNRPVLFVTNGVASAQNTTILKIIEGFVGNGEAHNIAVLCPWGEKSVLYFYNLIKSKFPTCTYFYRKKGTDFGCEDISNIHITTFKSAKGLEFDTVIIPNFDLAFDDFSSYYALDWKHYYVGVTRAKTNLYLISSRNLEQINDCVEVEYL
nr:3'-5' exonuclease [uncultured Bacteroides sp.]